MDSVRRGSAARTFWRYAGPQAGGCSFRSLCIGLLALVAIATLSGCSEPDFARYLAAPDVAAEARQTSAWPRVGGDGSAKFADLTQITPQNVSDLAVAWSFKTGEPARVFQGSPIIAAGQLVFCSSRNTVFSLDPLTGATRWRFDARIADQFYGNEMSCRGVTQWDSGASGVCAHRIFMATNDARLIALDVDSGEVCADFGVDGEVDLHTGVGSLHYPGEYSVTAAPVVGSDTVIIGGSISDNQRIDAPSGVVRGFDARTGALRWAFDLAPPDFDPEVHPVSDAGYALGTPNVWASMVVDEDRDMVFLPTGNPAPDYARPAEPDMDHFGSSVVALRASSGEYLWHFNTVLNDFWDFDVPSAPSLVDLTLNGEEVPALIQGTKMGFIFVLNRETGVPLIDVEYREVPRYGPLENMLSPLQPFPPEAFQVSRTYRGGHLPLDMCGDLDAESQIGPVYTPITEQWTVGLPSNMGAINWGGVAVDAARGLIAVNTNNVPFRTRLIPREQVADLLAVVEDRSSTVADRRSARDEMKRREQLPDDVELGMQAGTSFVMARHVMRDSWLGFVPCGGLPMAEVMVIDLAAQEQVWRAPHGTLRDMAGLPIRVGVPGMGGSLLTETGLMFIGAASEKVMRAYRTSDGESLWQHALPAPANAIPMSYTVRNENGVERQFVVIAAGGDARTGIGGLSDYLIAFSLPVKAHD